MTSNPAAPVKVPVLLPYAWCEAATSPALTPEHLRTISSTGLFPGGGLMATALCGVVLDGGWDIRQAASRDLAELPEEINDWRCPRCLAAALAQVVR